MEESTSTPRVKPTFLPKPKPSVSVKPAKQSQSSKPKEKKSVVRKKAATKKQKPPTKSFLMANSDLSDITSIADIPMMADSSFRGPPGPVGHLAGQALLNPGQESLASSHVASRDPSPISIRDGSQSPSQLERVTSASSIGSTNQCPASPTLSLPPGSPARLSPRPADGLAEGHPAEGPPVQGPPAEGLPVQGPPAEGHVADGHPAEKQLRMAQLKIAEMQQDRSFVWIPEVDKSNIYFRDRHLSEISYLTNLSKDLKLKLESQVGLHITCVELMTTV
jgi:hypothetical protein